MRKEKPMGGFGSTRWGGHVKAVPVEDCLTLSLRPLVREGVIRPRARVTGVWGWQDPRTGELTSTVGYAADTTALEPATLRLWYTITRTGEDVAYSVPIRHTVPRLGGVRWWLGCPLTIDGTRCAGRVEALYLPPGGQRFGCRRCHRLTYRSVQTHDKRADVLRRNPAALRALLNNPTRFPTPAELLLALKAMR